MLKPNLLAWRRAHDPACVDPAFLLECAKVFLDAGAKVSILENPAVQTAPAVIRAMGLKEPLDKLGVEVRSFTEFAPARNLPEMRFHNFETLKDYDTENIVIIELKRDGNIYSPITNILRDLHIHQTGFSKCCIGMVTTDPKLKQNNFKQKLRMLRKINIDETYQIRDTAESVEDNT